MIKRRNSGKPWKPEDDLVFQKLVAARLNPAEMPETEAEDDA
jgi:hypothetical protein